MATKNLTLLLMSHVKRSIPRFTAKQLGSFMFVNPEGEIVEPSPEFAKHGVSIEMQQRLIVCKFDDLPKSVEMLVTPSFTMDKDQLYLVSEGLCLIVYQLNDGTHVDCSLGAGQFTFVPKHCPQIILSTGSFAMSMFSVHSDIKLSGESRNLLSNTHLNA